MQSVRDSLESLPFAHNVEIAAGRIQPGTGKSAIHTTSISLLQRLKQPAAQESWTRFVNLYTPLLFFWARRLGLQETDAADLVQDVFTLLVKKLPHFNYQSDRSFRGWLRTVLYNQWRKKRPAQLATVAGLSDVADPGQAADIGEAEFQQQLTVRALQLMQAEFQPTTWRACWETVVSGRPASDVARELGISVNAVYLARSRVLRRLRQELERMLD
jgi:RNA polymerase sigma-70 factor (ECF subfamily)